MFKTLTMTLIFSGLAMMLGCGTAPNTHGSVLKSMPANQQNVENLQVLMNDHPEFSRASLQQIKNAALGTRNLGPDFQLAMPLETAPAPTSELDPELAKKAQELVDKILDDFDMVAQIQGAIKIMGISMNMAAQMLADFNKNMPSKDFSPKFSMATGGDEKFKIGKTLPTCQEIIDKPFGDMPKEKFEELIKSNHAQLKSALSGCAKIQGQVFVQCVADLNKMFGIVNEFATCAMNDFNELTSITEKEFGKSFDEINKSGEACMKKQFSQCGYVAPEPQH